MKTRVQAHHTERQIKKEKKNSSRQTEGWRRTENDGGEKAFRVLVWPWLSLPSAGRVL